jgi:hypothetical protein
MTNYNIVHVCAWCGIHIKGNTKIEHVISHGMCKKCLENELKDIRKGITVNTPQELFMEALRTPQST